jgi:hypothetical protein
MNASDFSLLFSAWDVLPSLRNRQGVPLPYPSVGLPVHLALFQHVLRLSVPFSFLPVSYCHIHNQFAVLLFPTFNFTRLPKTPERRAGACPVIILRLSPAIHSMDSERVPRSRSIEWQPLDCR